MPPTSASGTTFQTFTVERSPAGYTVALQFITPNEYRARATALYFFVVNLVGLGFGPMLIALLTDHLFLDDGALRYSIALVTGSALPLAAVILTAGFSAFARDIEKMADAE